MTSVSVLIPCYNEAAFIRGCLDSVLGFVLPDDTSLAEIFVIDGGSTDQTRQIVKEYAAADPRITMLDNPHRIQSTALNLGIRRSTGHFILRLDAHSEYPVTYLAESITTALRTGCASVGGIVATVRRGTGYQSALVQAITTHRFGVGDSGFRTGGREGPADTVPYGCFRRDIFDRVGFFDERLVRAQDYEMNRRIIAAGECVWRNPAIRVTYFQQPDLISFMRKQIVYEAPYNAYLWYVAPYAFTPRHAITGVFAAGLMAGAATSPFSSAVRFILLFIMALYVILALLAGAQQAIRYREPRHLVAAPIGFFMYHFLHGIGVLVGLVRLASRTAPVQKSGEPWAGAGRFRAWPVSARA